MIPTRRNQIPPSGDGFSLTEVVIAMGIVTFALVGIFAVSSASLNSGRESQEVAEQMLVAKSLPDFLQKVSPANGTNSLLAYSNASNWASAGYSNIFAYSSSNQIIISSTAPAAPAGRLYRISLSTNSISPSTNNAALGLRVTIRSVPNATAVPASASTLVYDTAILP